MSEHGPGGDGDRTRIRLVTSGRLDRTETAAVRTLLRAAFAADAADLSELDWEHALGGVHFLLQRDRELLAHAAIVERILEVGEASLRTGYVEAVATAPHRQGQGLGSHLMRAVSDHIRERFELGALSTGRHHFYARLGWRIWPGPTAVRTAAGVRRTADDDGGVMVLLTRSTPRLDPAATIICPWRHGDVW